MPDRPMIERRRGERRRGPRRFEERRCRPIPVAVDLRSGLDRRDRLDRRAGSERRSLELVDQILFQEPQSCDVLTEDGERCGCPAAVRGKGGDGWICLEHLVMPRASYVN